MSIKLLEYRYRPNVRGMLEGVALGTQKIIFVDPPYNIGVNYADDPIKDRMDPDAYKTWCRCVVQTLEPYLAPGGTIWWLCPAGHVDFIPGILGEIIGERRYMIIKQESFAQYQQKSLTEDYRLLFCYQKKGGTPTFNPDDIRIKSARLLQKTPDKRADPRGRVPGQVWDVRRLQGTSDDRVDWHPAQLPPELIHAIIKGWSNKGDSVMDAFAGSGNFGVAARLLERDCVLVEGSPTYCREIEGRLKLR